MREIEFRGKSVDSGKWFYGSLVINKDGTCEITDGAEHYGYLRISVQVIPETVGQFTGIIDSYDNKIYEGDVVIANGNKRCGKYTTYVVFNKNCFMLDDNKTIFIDNMSLINVEVIGNIYDNPEFLGGSDGKE